MQINVPDWCQIGKHIAWSNEQITGMPWVHEVIYAYGVDGFFHRSHNCPMYFTKFSEYGKTVKEISEVHV